PPPPPPPPVMAVPPPPYIPPPKIKVPPPPKPPIKHVAKAPPKHPTPPQTKTAAAPPATSAPSSAAAAGDGTTDAPDTSAGSAPLNNVQPVYPPEMEEDNIEGRVTLICDVEASGMTSNCHVQSVSGGQAFAQSALDYVHKARYRPATRNGAPVKELHKVYVIRFRLDD
ncbi:energy transducer TonB, partial [Acetobacter pasteurianus]